MKEYKLFTDPQDGQVLELGRKLDRFLKDLEPDVSVALSALAILAIFVIDHSYDDEDKDRAYGCFIDTAEIWFKSTMGRLPTTTRQ